MQISLFPPNKDEFEEIEKKGFPDEKLKKKCPNSMDLSETSTNFSGKIKKNIIEEIKLELDSYLLQSPENKNKKITIDLKIQSIQDKRVLSRLSKVLEELGETSNLNKNCNEIKVKLNKEDLEKISYIDKEDNKKKNMISTKNIKKSIEGENNLNKNKRKSTKFIIDEIEKLYENLGIRKNRDSRINEQEEENFQSFGLKSNFFYIFVINLSYIFILYII